MSTPKVFISYSHDSAEHREQVLALSERLRADGIETFLDQYVNGTPDQGWPRWMLDQLDAADFVLVVCTETYYRRFRGQEVPGKGKGVDWEGALITQELYDLRSRTVRFVPTLLSDAPPGCIPEPLGSVTYYRLTSEDDYQSLYDFLLNQAGVEARSIGSLKTKPRRSGAPLSFYATPAAQGFVGDVSRILKYAPAELIGREGELKLLNDTWARVENQEKGRAHVLTFVALGGEGKTSLVAKWAAELAHHDWPGCDTAFAWSFYSQGTREQVAASSDLFLKEALTFFGDDADKQFAASPAGAFEKGQRLARLVGQRRSLLILDGLEPLQYAPTSPTPGELKDQGVAALLKGLAVASQGLCIVTTRYSLPDLKAFWQTTAPEVKLLRLSRSAGVHLLQSFGVKGSLLRNIPFHREQVNEFEKLVEDVQGHALTLNLLGTYLRDAHAGDIRKRHLVKLEEADAEEQGGRAFRVMEAYEREFEREGEKGQRALAVLRLLGLFDRPLTSDCLGALLQAPAIPELTEPLVGLTEAQRNIAFKRLEDARLLTVNRDPSGALISLDAHPLLREYFARQLRANQPEAWRAAHRRLYEYLCATTPDKPQPTVEDLQPLYQAVAHGCQAASQQEAWDGVYVARILKRREHYSWKKLGLFGMDLGAASCFYESPWNAVSPSLKAASAAFLLNQTALYLRALGRLAEALQPMQAATEWAAREEEWENAAAGASNLSELELTVGEVAGAVADAEQSVTYADRGDDESMKMITRTIHADALHQTGLPTEAETRFREAEQMQKENQPDYALLYSSPGFRYCDLLLAIPERAAWQQILSLNSQPSTLNLTESCRAVSQRAATALEIVLNGLGSLLDIALNHLTLGRAALYAEILERSPDESASPNDDERRSDLKVALQTAGRELDVAVDVLRRSGNMDEVPRGLLIRAWCSFAEGSAHNLRGDAQEAARFFSRAQEDLDEAWEIAERGPMKLHMADIHLYRARLFGNRKAETGNRKEEIQYPWESPVADLAAAERLINDCGYHRRDEELADAKAALVAT
jgi:hypothetical protein